jgi:hypothetical protein
LNHRVLSWAKNSGRQCHFHIWLDCHKLKKFPSLIMPMSTMCQKNEKKMTINVIMISWYLRPFYNGAFSIVSNHDFDDQFFLLAIVHIFKLIKKEQVMFALRKCSVSSRWLLLSCSYPNFFFFLAKWPLNCVLITEINHSNNFLFWWGNTPGAKNRKSRALLHIIFSAGTILNVGKIVIVKIEVG